MAGKETLCRGREATEALMNTLVNRTDVLMTLKKLGVECTTDRLDEFMPERWMTLRDLFLRLV